jgi:uncharacterized protein YndB with AHSA1/START domain/uncharacterized damage-inducible protein DinB
MTEAKSVLKQYLQRERDALLWKLEGLSERDARWPMTPTGTNILGLVKHVASVELGYFGEVFDRPSTEPMPWLDDDADDNADMWAAAEQSIDWVVDFYHRVWRHSDATIDALGLDAPGAVPWWPPERRDVTLHQILVHMIDETARHVGHADIVRELLDGHIGLRSDNSNLPDHDAAWWTGYVHRLKQVADAFGEGRTDDARTDDARTDDARTVEEDVTSPTDEQRVASATRTIDAPADRLFELIADPSQQPRWDGNDNLAHADAGQRVHHVGDVFRTVLTGERAAVRENHVVEFEEGRRIAWMPAEPGGEPIGQLWRWELRPDGQDRTVVTHTYDWTRLTDEKRFSRARATTTERLLASIDRLAAVLE